jgi:hypothetical protein
MPWRCVKKQKDLLKELNIEIERCDFIFGRYRQAWFIW